MYLHLHVCIYIHIWGRLKLNVWWKYGRTYVFHAFCHASSTILFLSYYFKFIFVAIPCSYFLYTCFLVEVLGSTVWRQLVLSYCTKVQAFCMYCIVLRSVVLYWTAALHHTALYYTACPVLYCAVLYCAVLCTVIYYTVPYCIHCTLWYVLSFCEGKA